ncbi:hypothetical protein EX895_002668 [Sporisorium graminicola]|uniref:FAD/NAD(P)-binding domain-containing protein n=1 Tax=Sporisorium graminicola TaxID=280036 RepID=A0A4U7KVU4_9BASI|nr:hypothetical protein EX895_002668 [Sporisorium graminicola]TKY88316.1 hypothetical protein EX895_002668 [Sporisorium graminicola]
MHISTRLFALASVFFPLLFSFIFYRYHHHHHHHQQQHQDIPQAEPMNIATAMSTAKPSTIAIVGGSYVGMRLAQALIPVLPASHRVVVVEANSHFHHLFTFPRFAVLHRGGEEKALIPYTHTFEAARDKASIVHARALSVHAAPEGAGKGWLQLDRASEGGKDRLEFDFLAIATGTQLCQPWSLPSTHTDGVQAKKQAVETLRRYQDAVKEAQRIVIVGGGAVGVQVACDISELYPAATGKKVTLLHSRERVMNKFHPELHAIVAKRFAERGVSTHLGSRVVIPAGGFPSFAPGQTFDVELQNGTKVPADLVLMCTGQTPHSALLASFAPHALSPDGFINVLPTMQIDFASSAPSPLAQRMFALGDIANSGASKTVRAAMGQIDTITSNILALIQGDTPKAHFTPGPSGIHLSLGLYESIVFRNPANEGDAPAGSGIKRDLKLDMGIEDTWSKWNVPQGTPWHL